MVLKLYNMIHNNKMDTPQNHIWGPELWMILHSTAERIDSSKSRLANEEWRMWHGLLNSLRYSLPCPQCKKHYNEYYAKTPIVHFSKEMVRNWLFQLHQQINVTNKKQEEYTIDKVEEQYKQPFCFSTHLNVIRSQMVAGIRLQWTTRVDIQRTMRVLEEMKRYYDFF